MRALLLDGRAMVGVRTGIGWYTALLTEAICQQAPELAVTLVTHRRPADLPSRVQTLVVPFPATVRLRYLWEQALLPWALRGYHDALWHSPLTTIPGRLNIPRIATVHDVAFHLYPEILPPSYRRYWENRTRWACRDADCLIAVSDSTRADLVHYFGADPDRIEVIPEAADPFYHQPVNPSELDTVAAELGLPRDFWLVVGTLEPRKNLPFLLKAYRRALSSNPRLPALVIAGGQGWLSRGLQAELDGMGDHVRVLGYLKRPQLRALYHLASCFWMPSRYEGFGLPALEAMACGTAVVAANASSLPEVLGNTGRLLDLADPEAWVATMLELSAHPDLAASWAQPAQQRAACFSWSATARQTLAVYHRLSAG